MLLVAALPCFGQPAPPLVRNSLTTNQSTGTLANWQYPQWNAASNWWGFATPTTIDPTRPPFNADPTGVADATAAFQAAVDYIGDQTARPILEVPAGTFSIVGTLVIDHTIVMRGASPRYGSTGTQFIKTGTGAAILVAAEGVTLSNFKIDGVSVNNARYGISYFKAYPTTGCPYQIASSISLINLRGGMLLAHTWSSAFEYLRFSNCGDDVTISNHCSQVVFINCDFNSATNGVRYVNDTGAGNGTGGSAFVNCGFQNSKFGVIATNVQVSGVSLFSCHFENNTTNDVYLVDSPGLQVLGGTFSAVGTTNIHLVNAHSPTILGIKIADNSVPLYADAATTGMIYEGTVDTGGYGLAAVINATDALTIGDGIFKIGAQPGIATTADLLIEGSKTNRLVFVGGILVSNITNFHD